MTRHLRTGGDFHRVADADWTDPLDPSYAARRGGRWNPPGTFGVVYLCADLATARANVARLLAGLPYGPEDLDPDRAPVLVDVEVDRDPYADAVTDRGLGSLGLPATYPIDDTGQPIPHPRCQRIGTALFQAGELGVSARSAAPAAAGGRELAWFDQPGRRRLQVSVRHRFADWYWG